MTCFEFESHLSSQFDAADGESRDRHLARCPECRIQYRVHRVLEESVGTMPVIHMSAEAADRIARRIRAEQEPMPRSLRGVPLVLMGAYWLGAAAALLYIFHSLGFPFSSSETFRWLVTLVLAPLSFAASLWAGEFVSRAVRLFAGSGVHRE